MQSNRFGAKCVVRVVGAAASVIGAQAALGQCGYAFSAPTGFGAGLQTRGLLLADVDGDGKLDVGIVDAWPSNAQISLYRGTGTGTLFSDMRIVSTIPNGLGLFAADFNGDGRVDIAVYSGTTVQLHIAQAGPSWINLVQGTTLSSASTIQWAGAGKLDADTLPDIAYVTATLPSRTASWVRNIGAAQFAAPVNQSSVNATAGVLADMNNDGLADLVTSASGLVMHLNSGSGFLPWTSKGTLLPPLGLVTADFDHNGFRDVALPIPDYPAADRFLNSAGTLTQQPPLVSVPGASAIAVADMNGDGHVDLIVGGTSSLGIHLGNGNGTFQALTGVTSIPFPPNAMQVADINGDGIPDAVYMSTIGQANVALGRITTATQITQQPSNQSVGLGQPASMSIAVNSLTDVSFQWRRNGTPLTNGGTMSGVTTPTLSISLALVSDAGAYDCQVIGGCNGTLQSNPAAFWVNTCYANCDNSTMAPVLNVSDFSCFLQKYAAGCQ